MAVRHPESLRLHRDPASYQSHSTPHLPALSSFDRRLCSLIVSDLDPFRPIWLLNSPSPRHHHFSLSSPDTHRTVFPHINRRLMYTSLNTHAELSQSRVVNLLQIPNFKGMKRTHCYSQLKRGVAAREVRRLGENRRN